MSDPLRWFDPPANWDDFPRNRRKREALRNLWSERVREMTERGVGANYYNPLTTRIGDAQPAGVEWSAFPKPIEDGSQTLAQKLALADQRDRQVEYCEWVVKKDSRGKITRVTFTSETVEYWRALWDTDPDRVLALYRKLVSPDVPRADLETGTGYNPDNRWNRGGAQPDGVGAVHMTVDINTLDLAIGVAAGASSGGDDNPRGGGAFHADELIDLSVKRLVVRLNLRVSLSNPLGLYLQEPEFNRFELPPGAPRSVQPGDFWTVVRGDRANGRALRAVYEVPTRLGFKVGDIKIDGNLIENGSQIARTLKSGTYVTPIPRT
jgi:hypothetical protein